MSLHQLSGGDRIPTRRGDVVVVIPLFGAHDLFVQCLRSVLDHTPDEVPILVADDAGPDPSSLAFAERLDAQGAITHDLHWLRQEDNLGFVGNCNAAFAAADPADVVLVNSDVVVAEGWLEGLRDAAHSDTTIATASTLTNHGSILSVPVRNLPTSGLPQNATLETLAAGVRARSARLRPRIPTAVGHCVYIRREALELVGGFDDAFSPGYGEEVDFSQRCLLMGLQHVAADDVLVLHRGGSSFGKDGELNPIQEEHEQLIAARYGFYHPAVEQAAEDPASPLARALTLARQVLVGRRVTIDARCLGPLRTGTQVHALELIAALYRAGGSRLRVVVPSDLGDYARDVLAEMPGIVLLPEHEVGEETEPDDVVHRPFQLHSIRDVEYLSYLGDRTVVTHQDLIAYRNPSYHPSGEAWLQYQKATAHALSAVDMVLFFSRHAMDDALADDLVSPSRSRVVHIGVDHRDVVVHDLLQRPAAVPDDGLPFLVCVGTRFRHKNRLFALKILEQLRDRHGWAGRLVFAGPDVADGSSAGAEAEYLAEHRDLAGAVVEVAAVSDAEKDWLVKNAAGVLYPSTYEGFGLVPFEAAELDTPCFHAAQSAVGELLPDSVATLVPWDAAASADAIIAVLADAERGAALVAEIRAVARQYTWDAAAVELTSAYDAAVAAIPSRVWRYAGGLMNIDMRYWSMRQRIGGTGLALVGADKEDPLIDERGQRALAALAQRSATRGPLLWLLHLVNRLGGSA